MFKEELKKYKIKGIFSFNQSEALADICDAPTDKNGVYLICKIVKEKEVLLYIGSSGRKVNGILRTRKVGLGGMRDRLVNGYHPKFGKIKRKKAFPKQMEVEKINELKFYWWVTYDDYNLDFPTDIETVLRNKYLAIYKKLPDWHK